MSTAKKAPSRKPVAKKTAAKKTAARPSDISAFKQKATTQLLDKTLLELPSGLFLECDRTNLMSAFLGGGFVPNSLMTIVQEHIQEGTEMKPEEAAEMAQDPDQINDLFEMVNQVVIRVAQEPKIHPLPEKGKRKVSTKLYIDELNEEDKMFIFQWATGGTTDLATFREESRADVAAIFGGQVPGLTAKRPVRSRRR